MAKAKTDARVNGNGVAFGPATLPHFEPLLTVGGRMLETWQAIGNELIEFSRARVDQSIEMGKAMVRSSNFNEAIELQAKFAQSMMSDLLGEARKLADISTRPMIEGIAATQKATHSGTPPTSATK
jgi:phasin family protein